MFILDVQQEKNLKKTRISHAISNLGGCLLAKGEPEPPFAPVLGSGSRVQLGPVGCARRGSLTMSRVFLPVFVESE